MIKGKTKSGFVYQISEQRLNNYELIEEIQGIEKNPLNIVGVVNLLLGKELANKLKEHVRDKDGFVPADVLTDEIMEIFQNQSATKNS